LQVLGEQIDDLAGLQFLGAPLYYARFSWILSDGVFCEQRPPWLAELFGGDEGSVTHT